jgi:RNA polymerase sigma-B factor
MTSVDDIPDPPDEGPGPEALAAFRELRDELRRELAKLMPRDRLVLRLRFEQELTLSAIARLTGAGSPQAVDRWIRDVLQRLRRNLS